MMDEDTREILGTFAAETDEHIKRATDCILSIEEGRDEEAINGLFRAFHTIKGNSRMLKFDKIGDLAHSAENVIARLRNDTLKPSKQVIDLLLSTLDAIEALITDSLHGTDEAGPVETLGIALEEVASGNQSPQNVLLSRPDIRAVVYASQHRRHKEGDSASEKKESRGTESVGDPPINKEEDPTEPKKMNILVVEDDFASRKILVSLLKNYGECDVAVDGKEAVTAFASALDEKPYDLVCMDIMMPEMDGFEAARQIRVAEMMAAVRNLKEKKFHATSFNRRDAVIVMTSSLDDPEHYINACYRCGANAYLVKPIDAETVESTLVRFALMKGTWRSVPLSPQKST